MSQPVAQETFKPHERISFLVHSEAKVGKSSLLATAPKPVCVLDADASWTFIGGRKIYWNPMKEYPPKYDGTWDICIVDVLDWDTVLRTHDFIRTGQTEFVSVGMDSITVIQKKLKDNLRDGGPMRDHKDWGNLLTEMDKIITGYRDLTRTEGLTVRCVVFTAETKWGIDKWRPSMQGQIAGQLPYAVDACGYMYPYMAADQNGQPTVEQRHLLIGPNDAVASGSRVGHILGNSLLVPAPPPGQTGTVIEDWMKILFNKNNDQGA